MSKSIRRNLNLLVVLLVLSIVSTTVTWSRYRGTMTASASAQVARPVIDLQLVSASYNDAPVEVDDDSITIKDPNAGDRLEIKFKVLNHKDGATNQVLLDYVLTASVLRKGHIADEELEGSPVVINLQGHQGTCGTSPLEIYKHSLNVTWPADTQAGDYSISINLDAVQQDPHAG